MIASALADMPGVVLSAFLVFCRIGTCLMVLPAIGSARVPVQVRLMLCFGASAAVSAAIGPFDAMRQGTPPVPILSGLILAEIGKGLYIGFMARFFFASLQFLVEAAANAIGLSFAEASPEDGESQQALTSLMTIAASALFVITDQHLEILRALVQSYRVLPFGVPLNQETEMVTLMAALARASLLAMQVSSPFLVYAIVINFIFGILNRLAPQIPVAFVSAPFIVGGGLLLFFFLSDEIFEIFMVQFADWLASG